MLYLKANIFYRHKSLIPHSEKMGLTWECIWLRLFNGDSRLLCLELLEINVSLPYRIYGAIFIYIPEYVKSYSRYKGNRESKSAIVESLSLFCFMRTEGWERNTLQTELPQTGISPDLRWKAEGPEGVLGGWGQNRGGREDRGGGNLIDSLLWLIMWKILLKCVLYIWVTWNN